MAKAGMSPATSATGTQAVDRAASLLLAVLESPQPPTFAQLQRSSGLAKSTLSRLLSSLERHGLVSRGDDGGIRPGHAITRFARSDRPDADLIALAMPHLEAIGARTGETVNLAVPVAGEVEQIAQVDATFVLGSMNWVGHRVPLHCSALGKVFLAGGAALLPDGPLAGRTPETITSRTRLDAELAGVRERGWAWCDSELEPGLVAVAAPVRAADGKIVAGISVSGPSVRIGRSRIDELGALVAAEAAALSGRLGYPGTTTRKATVA